MTFPIIDDTELIDQYSEVCTFCVHYLIDQRCKAFKKIPEAIWSGKNKHTESYPGDNGTLFKEIKK